MTRKVSGKEERQHFACCLLNDCMDISLLDLQEHLNDYPWLDNHAEIVYQQIKDGLKVPLPAANAINMLNVFMPYAVTRPDYRRWEGLLYDALTIASETGNEEAQIHIWSHLGSCCLQSGRCQTAAGAFRNAIQRSGAGATPEARLLARIGMLHAKTVYETSDIESFIQDALDAAYGITDCYRLGKLHYALAKAYTHRAETERALGHGQFALGCWYLSGNVQEQAYTIMMLAEASRVAMRYSQAVRYLNRINPDMQNNYEAALFNYQQGAVLLESGQIEAAAAHLQAALEQFSALDFPYLTGAACHSLALAETKLQQFEVARDHLRFALITWQKLEICFEQANCVYALGFLEETAQNFDAARELNQLALSLTDNLPDTPLVAALRQEIVEHLERLPQ